MKTVRYMMQSTHGMCKSLGNDSTLFKMGFSIIGEFFAMHQDKG